MSNITVFDQVAAIRPRFTELAEKSGGVVVYDREQEFANQLLAGNKFLLSTAQKDPYSLQSAMLNLASVGLSLNPALAHAYLVPMDGKVCMMPSYKGLIALAKRSGVVQWVKAMDVKESDEFIFRGISEMPEHNIKNPFTKNRGDIVGLYCVVKLSSGDLLVEMMSADEVNEIMQRSKSYIAYAQKRVKSCPWVTDWAEMAKKTIIKRALKVNIDDPFLARAVSIDNEINGYEQEQEVVDVTPASDEQIEEALKLTELLGRDEKAVLSWLNRKFSATHESLNSATFEQLSAFIDMAKKRLEAESAES